ncbi:MAG: hypothetical protein AAB380_05525 [Verrucomicrobiota bacterium]|mgnify:CR=1 FL=1
MRIQSARPAAKGLQAFTITEVVIAIVIVVIGTAGLMSCFSYSFKVIQRVRENQRATQIILEKAETLRLFSWDQVNTSGFIPSTFTATYDGDAAASNYTGTIYYGNVSIDDFPEPTSYQDKMRALNLTLHWTSLGITRTRSLTTYIAQDGIQNYVY